MQQEQNLPSLNVGNYVTAKMLANGTLTKL